MGGRFVEGFPCQNFEGNPLSISNKSVGGKTNSLKIAFFSSSFLLEILIAAFSKHHRRVHPSALK